MAATHILTRDEAQRRAELLRVESYTVELDLTGHEQGDTFGSRTVVKFSCTEPGAETFIEIAAERIEDAYLNGEPVNLTAFDPKAGLKITGLAAENELVVNAIFAYSTDGQGLHRMVDPVDKETYLYSQFEVADAQRVYACFDQPDLKAKFTFQVRTPKHWTVISNMPAENEAVVEEINLKVTLFEESVRMSPYITAICAGPYFGVFDEHDGIGLGLYARQSMKDYLDPEGVFEVTRQGFDHFHEKFGVRYPLPKYDQVFAPEYNFGAMENFGCITIAEASFLFRSQVTDFELEQRANVILHEMAHMWFGDLVTMRWWDDLWLNESFAEWASHWANVEATRFDGAWTTFLSARKNWGYGADQQPTTHPVYTAAGDTEEIQANFDGITYSKGASILKQLVAYVGIDPFLAGLRSYFQKHQFGNAVFQDLLGELEAASGKPLKDFADTWLRTAGVSTLRPDVAVDADGNYTSVTVLQEVPAEHPTHRTHRIAIGLYDLDGERLVRRDRIEVDVTGAATEIAALAGVKQPDFLLLNDDDLTYAKLRLDERSLATAVEHTSALEDSLARALIWAAAWDMLRDAELPATQFVELGCRSLTTEDDINIVTVAQRQVAGALAYADPAKRAELRDKWAQAAKAAMEAAAPGSDPQRSWAKAYASASRSEADLARIAGWLEDREVPEGLAVDADLRWAFLTGLVGNGAVPEDAIDAELDRDSTADGRRLSYVARAVVPTPEAKQRAWERITDPNSENWVRRSSMLGFAPLDQADLVRPYLQQYLDAVPELWEKLGAQQAVEFSKLAFPSNLIEAETLEKLDAWLAEERPAPVKRGVAEGRADIARALKGRELDRP
ncbi:aminopeptidase N [Glycomyces algeriensis]|uniref:Aminopeptidase N n=1 Tax=Glycomyces algeriensis TaxID=256037 RepID=A0A9W6LH90_9ACTN|nr:aminopeptidase N [Glycomyces algeriensis]MDA1365241.1 aminopeptidase N [Glycomyces algeriensis]MDR7349695.1 aminopeptidase N [Glycomyces algeriensis]GLI42406.1 aminopeptidase N [Glycomyces algeriensis]